MGSINCCSYNTFSLPSKTMIIDKNDKFEEEKLRNANIQKFNKKSSLNFDKKNFINMKTKNLFEDYEVKDKLGEGSYGCVYKAIHKKTKLIRAVKAIKRKHVDDVAFNNEISILRSLDHPHIIRLFECYYDNSFYYMIQEYCSGGDLYDYIKRQKNFSEKKAASIIHQIISAINHLHSKKITHRDLKPENIVFVETKTNEIFIKIIDFGTSIFFNDSPLKQEIGTIYYISPEVFKSNYNEKSDIWSCGVILYTLLSGHPPFRGRKEEEIKSKIIKGDIEYPIREWNDISKEAMHFINELLTYKPHIRPSAEQALNNPWLNKMLKSDNNDEDFLGKHVMRNIAKFHFAVTLQKASMAFIATYFGQNEEIIDLKNSFDKIDNNKDGVLSTEELIECLSKINPVHEVDKKLAEILEAVDFNNDGYINFSEFMTVCIKKQRLLCEENMKRAFNMFDIVIELFYLMYNIFRMVMVILLWMN